LLLAIAVWGFATNLLGDVAGILAAFLFLSEPNIVGNATVVQDDLASALSVFLFVILLRAYFGKPILIRALALGVTIGVGLLIKHSLVVLAPICLVLLLAHGIWRKIKYKEHLCRFLNLGLVVTCCFSLILVAGYAFDAGFIDDDEASFVSDWFHLTGDFANSFQTLLVHLPVLLPKYYLYGMDMVMNDVQNGRPAFIFGQVFEKGVWYYFPAAFVLKTSLPFLTATIAGLVWTAWEIVKRKWLDGLYLLLPPLIYLAMSMTSHLNIGVRHIMPIFPFFAAMAAGAIVSFANSNQLRRWQLNRIVGAALILWAAILVVVTYPNYLTYFSPLAGGSANGWKLLSDSNAETGQEVKNLADFLKQRGETKVNGLFMGSGYIEFYGIEECDLPCSPGDGDQDTDEDQTGGQALDEDDSPQPDDIPAAYVAIGAWYLQEVEVTPEQKAAIDPYR
jgi:4-amino-4-deoxy-L-arabinose transferase-like glycosyltransferase